jgi:hypothetical protein
MALKLDILLKITVINSVCKWLHSDCESHRTIWRNALPKIYKLRNMFYVLVYTCVHSSLNSGDCLRHVILNNCIFMWATTWLNTVRWTIDRSVYFFTPFSL